jgi:hypothetical protein
MTFLILFSQLVFLLFKFLALGLLFLQELAARIHKSPSTLIFALRVVCKFEVVGDFVQNAPALACNVVWELETPVVISHLLEEVDGHVKGNKLEDLFCVRLNIFKAFKELWWDDVSPNLGLLLLFFCLFHDLERLTTSDHIFAFKEVLHRLKILCKHDSISLSLINDLDFRLQFIFSVHLLLN